MYMVKIKVELFRNTQDLNIFIGIYVGKYH